MIKLNNIHISRMCKNKIIINEMISTLKHENIGSEQMTTYGKIQSAISILIHLERLPLKHVT